MNSSNETVSQSTQRAMEVKQPDDGQWPSPKFLITSGGTKIKIDRVRSITNMSRGTFGARIASQAIKWSDPLGVTFLHVEGSRLPEASGPYTRATYVTFDDYATTLFAQLKNNPDIVVLAAAVSDYGVENYVDGKIRSSEGLTIKLKPLPKLIGRVRDLCPKCILCGFKLLVDSSEDELLEAAHKSIVVNGCDLVVANDLADIQKGNHKVFLVTSDFVMKFEANSAPLASVVVAKCLELYYQRFVNTKDTYLSV